MLPLYNAIHNAELYLESIKPDKEKAYDQGEFNEACAFFDTKKDELTEKMAKAIRNLPYSKDHLPPK
jgi:hypothetical protein